MTVLRYFFKRLRALWRSDDIHDEISEEMRFHIELRAEENVRRGMTPEEARRKAEQQFGRLDRIKEESYDVRGGRWLEATWQDLRYGARILQKNPGFTAVAVLTLALGIGATTAIFSVVNGILLKPLPYHHPEELVALRLTAHGWGVKDLPLSASTYFIFRERSSAFRDIGIYASYSVDVTSLGEPERAPALSVTDGLLTILGVKPLLGRSFTRVDDSPESAETAILTYGYWSRKFGADTSVIGRTIEVEGKLHTIIGVLPEDFRFLDQANLALLLPMKLNREKTVLGGFGLVGIARLKPGVTLAQANADVAHMLPIVNRSFPPHPGFSAKIFEDAMFEPTLRSLQQDVVGDVGKVLWVLMGSVSLLLVIACANLANLLLVRADGRRQELAIRAALGATRGRIASQLLFESLMLAIFGGLFGLGLAYGALRVVVAVAPQGLPRLNEIGVDGTVALFTVAVSLVAGLLFSYFPVFKYAGAGHGIGLRAGGRSISESRERLRSRGVLVIIQVALALVLLVTSGLMIRTFLALTRVNPGFVAPAEVQTFGISIPETQVKAPEQVFRTEERILRKIEAIPGVTSVGLSMNVPMDVPMDGKRWRDTVYAKDIAYPPGAITARRFQFVAPGFFTALGTPLLAGRDFTWSEIDNKVPVAIVSENLAREYWRDPLSALGKQIRVSQKGDWREVVGVVGDVRQGGVGKEAPHIVFWPIIVANFYDNPNVFPIRNVTFAIRSSRAGSEGLLNEIRQAVWSVSPNLPLADVRTLNDNYTRSMARTSFTLVMLVLAGGMALFLGIVGLYGVIAYSVQQRRREIGIRIALGAEKRAILKLVISQGIKLALIGVAIGLTGALGLTRFLSGLLYGVRPGDPLTLFAVSSLLMVVAFFASYIPARQAAKVDPMVALRTE
jgi:predicted permease